MASVQARPSSAARCKRPTTAGSAAAGGLDGPDLGVVFVGDELYVSGWYSDRVHRYDGATGAPLGDLIGRSRTLNAMLDPFITAFNATPRLVFLPLLPALRYLQRRQLAAYDAVRTAVGSTLSEVSELVTGAPVVLAYGLEDRTRGRLDHAIRTQYKAQMGAAKWFAVMFPLADLFGAITLVALYPNPLTFAAAIMLIGSRQLGLAILMHDGAHGCLSRNDTRNGLLGQWLCAYPIFADMSAYRRYHLTHHAHTQLADDPDLVLSAPFPITRASYRRKLWRDLSGQTGYQQRKAQLLFALGRADWPLRRRVRHFRDKLGPQMLVNVLLLGVLSLAGIWWAYPLLWLLPLITWNMVITRIRNIAEHAVVPDSADPLRNTRTTKAGLLARAFIAPYYVNYHLEHHLLFYVPCYNLPKVHRILMQGPHATRMEVQPGYAHVLRMATAKPAAEDQPGAIVNNARRARDGGVGGDQASSGF